VRAGPRHLDQEHLEWWEVQEAWQVPTPLNPQAGLQPPSLASPGDPILEACFRVPANFLNWQKTVTRNFIFRLVSWQDHGVQWLCVTLTQRHVASRHVKPTMPYLVMSRDILTCLFHIVFNHDTRVRHQSFPPSHPKLFARFTKTPKKDAGSQWESNLGKKIAQNLSSQDPRRCTDAIRGRAALYVIQRIWSCINQNLNLPPHAAFRGQKTTFWISSFQFDARQSRAHCYLPQLLINNKRDRSLPNIEKLCKEQYFQKKTKNLYFQLFQRRYQKNKCIIRIFQIFHPVDWLIE